jgi:hypothetical protein
MNKAQNQTWKRKLLAPTDEVPAKQKKTDFLPEYKSFTHVTILALQSVSYMRHFALFAVCIHGVDIALLWMQHL